MRAVDARAPRRPTARISASPRRRAFARASGPNALAGTDLPGGGQELVEYASEGNLRRLNELLDGAYAADPTDASSRAIRIAQLRTAAQRAMACGQVETLKRVLEFGDARGVDFGFGLGNGRLCAIEACGRGQDDVVRVLFKDGRVSTEVVNGYGRTALLEAALENKLECVRACLEAGANVDFTTKMQGNTAAHLAAQSGHVEVLNLLRDAGARMDIERFGDLKTALQLHRESVARTMKTMLDR